MAQAPGGPRMTLSLQGGLPIEPTEDLLFPFGPREQVSLYMHKELIAERGSSHRHVSG